jgi:short subunit dehydrogenase-like uncharacterized protein
MSGRWMIYGANGYTGRLIVDLAREQGLTPILAGRNSQAILEMAKSTGLPGDIFDLSDSARVARRIKGLDLVLNCAGPFSHTAKQMLSACIASKVSYLDITGEIDVFEMIYRREREIQDAGICAIPGVGFDVVPTDALANLLKAKVPDASRLVLAFNAHNATPSPGTAKTLIEGISYGGRIRKDGAIVGVPTTFKTGMIPFAEGSASVVTIPWGDISTAYRSTGIRNIEVHMAVKDQDLERLRKAEGIRWLLSIPFVRTLLQKYIARTFKGPGDEERQSGKVSLWGEVENDTGHRERLTMQTPNGYSLTAAAAMAAVGRVLSARPNAGVYTPIEAFGSEFALTLPGVKLTQPEMALS